MTDWTQYARGIDVSRWQGEIDWSSQGLDGVQFAIVKLSDGMVRAHRSRDHLDGVRGTTILPGVYHLWQPLLPGAAQADLMLSLLPPWWGAGCLPPALDIETKMVDALPSAADDVQSMLSFGRRVIAELAVKPVIYISPRGIRHLEREQRGITSGLPGIFDLWLCDYDRLDGLLPRAGESPAVCDPWTTWRLWQYTSSLSGRAHGARSRNLDGDIYNGSDRELARWAQGAWT